MSRTKRTHGFSSHPLYSVWYGMKQRCLNPKSSSYVYYGGRGIKIQENWLEDPRPFIAYAESLPRYEERVQEFLSLDRIDNNADYVEGNLRWATPMEQELNKRIPPEYQEQRKAYEESIKGKRIMSPAQAKSRARFGF